VSGSAGSGRPRPAVWGWVVLALLVGAAAAVRARLLALPLDRDEGEYAYFAQLLLAGIPPYAQAYNFKMPGIYAIYALSLAAFGQTPTGIHLGLLVVDAVTSVLVFLLTGRLFGTRVAVIAAATFATLSLSPRLFAPWAYAERFVLAPALAGLLVLLHAIERRGRAWFVGSGVLLGAAFLVKQSGGAFALFAVLYVLLGTRGDPRGRLGAAGAVVVGAAAPFAALCVVMALAGTFANFWFWTFTYAFEYATATSLATAVANLGSALRWILPTSYLAAALAGLGLSALFWDAETRPGRPFVVLLFACSCLATSAGLYFRNQYFILLLPVLAILAGVAVDAVARRLAPVRRRSLRYGLPIALAAVPLLHLVYLERAILFTDTPPQVLRALYGMNPFLESVEIAHHIRERTLPDDRIAVIGSEPEIYFYARRRAATGYVYTYALMEPQPYAAPMQRQMIREIEANDPKFVVFVKVLSSWLVTPSSDTTIFDWFARYQTRYDRVGIVELVSLGRTTYLWGPEAAAYTPRSDNWLAIFERKRAASGGATGER